MMGWLKKKLKRWLLDSEAVPRTIQAIHNSELRSMSVQEVIGLKLRCVYVYQGWSITVLIGSTQTPNPTEFWRLWKQLGGQANWGDGTKFEPTAERH